jgi:hypothetical protein
MPQVAQRCIGNVAPAVRRALGPRCVAAPYLGLVCVSREYVAFAHDDRTARRRSTSAIDGMHCLAHVSSKSPRPSFVTGHRSGGDSAASYSTATINVSPS